MRKLQAKPEYQRAVSYLLEKLRSVQDKGGLHAERMETQLKGTSTHTPITVTLQACYMHRPCSSSHLLPPL